MLSVINKVIYNKVYVGDHYQVKVFLGAFRFARVGGLSAASMFGVNIFASVGCKCRIAGVDWHG